MLRERENEPLRWAQECPAYWLPDLPQCNESETGCKAARVYESAEWGKSGLERTALGVGDDGSDDLLFMIILYFSWKQKKNILLFLFYTLTINFQFHW